MLLNEFFAQPQQVNEGGAVFPETVAIKKEYVPDLVKQIKKLLKGLNVYPDIGSAGYKIQSGDMDVMIDAQDLINKFGVADTKEAKKMLQGLLTKKKLDTKLTGQNVHVKMPLPDGAFGQVDIMVIPDAKYVAPYHQHGLRGNYDDPEFKGKEIFMVIASIAKSMGYKFEPFGGKLVKRDTGDLVARSRDDVARILLNPSATGDDLNNVKTIMAALKDDPRKEEKLAQVRQDVKKGMLKLPEEQANEGLKMGDYGHEKEKAAIAAQPKPYVPKMDMTGKVCKSCHKGRYQETSQFDDMDGMLHCPKCGAGTKRWVAKKVKEEFTGYWKGKDKGTPGKKMVGAAESTNEEVNPTDKITMDVPLFIRALEYAKEDAKSDMDLHNLTDRAIKLMQQNDCLSMDNYDELVGGEASVDEEKIKGADGKACWDGYRYNGTKNGKDSCVKVNNESEDEDDIDAMITWHNIGLGNANYKGPSATHHRKVLKKLYKQRADKLTKNDN